ncbi:MAG: GtrA family protein [Clostridia bacterium]|nr:GtrA family protein [Clostridia bacterium]
MTAEKKKDLIQLIKFVLFSASAGVIQFGSFTLMNELLLPSSFMQNLISQHEAFGKIMQNEYGPIYLIALILSVIWNFTFNRKFTFKSAANIPIAMLKVFGYYLVFTPVSTIIGNHFTASGVNEYIVLIITMLCNMATEFLFTKFVVYRNQIDTAVNADKAED